MFSRSIRRCATAGTVLVISAAGMLTAAPLASASSASPIGASAVGHNCVQAAAHAGEASAAAICFTRFDDAVSFATGGTVHLANAATSRQVTATELASASPLASGIISIMYADYNFGGDSHIWTGATCTSTNSYQNPSMPSGWNDRVGSVRTYLNCKNDLYYDPNYANVVFHIAANTNQASLGAMNDNASSLKWHV